MTRLEADKFLAWYKNAKEAQAQVASTEIVEDPAARDERNRVMNEVLEIFAPVADVVDVLFYGQPGEGLRANRDDRGNLVELARAMQPRVALS
jgi:hypothetical protein